jgi:uncharacterized protein
MRLSLGAVGILAFGLALAAQAAPLERLEVDTASGPHVFQVEVMRTPAELEHGLMDRREMARDRGMLFDFQKAQPVYFWMKNTYLPLDMIFVGPDGRVVNIKHDAKPMDETLIPSGKPTLGVIEVNAGVADAIGLKVGDTVKHPVFQGRS